MAEREPLDLKRRWLAITVATVAMQFSYWTIVFGVVAAEDDAVAGGGSLALGLSLMPFVFLIASFASRHERVPTSVLKAMGIFLAVALPVGLLDVVLGTVAGYAAGAAVALRREQELPSQRWRWIAAGACAVWVGVLLVAFPPFAVMSGAVLPFAVHGIVDQAVEDRERDLAAR